MSVQPDLFGEYDQAQAQAQAQAEADMLPQTCPHCGTIEPNAFLLRNNHWPDSPRNGLCIAQSLTVSHIAFAARNATDRLPGYLERGRALGLDVDQILAEVVTP